MKFQRAPWFLLLLLSACGWEARPVVSSAPSVPPPPPVHVVAQGDTLSELAELYRIPMAEIANLNGLTEPFTIRIGQVLRLQPAETATSASRSVASVPPASPSAAQSLQPSADSAVQLPPRRPEATEPPAQSTSADRGSEPVDTPSATEEESRTSAEIVRPPPVPSRPDSVGSAGAPVEAEPTNPPSQRLPQFAWPVAGEVIEGFSNSNSGVDIAAPLGAVVRSAEAGVVAYADDELAGFGNLVLVRHAGNWVTAYAHLDRILVRVGDQVGLGGIIGTVGNSGADRVALHFELRQGRDPIDPRRELPAR